jgi:hypothetical protein
MQESVSLVLPKSDNIPSYSPMQVVRVFLEDYINIRVLSKLPILGYLESLVTRLDANKLHKGRDYSSIVQRSWYFLSASPTQIL